MSPRRLPFALSLALAALTAAAPGALAEDLPPEALIEQKAPAIVSVKLVLRFGEHEVPREARGTVVDPSGIVLLADGWMGDDNYRPHDLKVLFGTDPKEWPSVLVARDRLLHVAFLQVIGLEKPAAAIDLAKGADLKIGQDLQSVWRDARGFDYAPGLRRHYVSGRVEKPRLLWALSGDGIDQGMPLFDAAGRPVGVAAQQESSSGAEEEDAESRTFALPLSDVLKSLEQARKRVPEAVAKAKEAGKEPQAPSGEGGMAEGGMEEGGMGEGGMGEEAPKAPESPEDPKEPKGLLPADRAAAAGGSR